MVLAHALLMTLTAGGLDVGGGGARSFGGVGGRGRRRGLRARACPSSEPCARRCSAWWPSSPPSGRSRNCRGGVIRWSGFPCCSRLWANLHGSFLMGLAALAAFAVGKHLGSVAAAAQLGGDLEPARRCARMAGVAAEHGRRVSESPRNPACFRRLPDSPGRQTWRAISEWRPTERGALRACCCLFPLPDRRAGLPQPAPPDGL